MFLLVPDNDRVFATGDAWKAKLLGSYYNVTCCHLMSAFSCEIITNCIMHQLVVFSLRSLTKYYSCGESRQDPTVVDKSDRETNIWLKGYKSIEC